MREERGGAGEKGDRWCRKGGEEEDTVLKMCYNMSGYTAVTSTPGFKVRCFSGGMYVHGSQQGGAWLMRG